MSNQFFSNTPIIVKFILKRDKIRLPIWILTLSAFVIMFIPIFADYVITGEGNAVMAEMMENPAMIAMVGPVYGAGNYTLGAAYANMMLVFSVMIAGVMNVFLISRHTLQDEELGRFELLRSLPIGRLSNLAASLIVSFCANTVLSVISGLGMYFLRQDGMDFSGCMLFGASLGIIGMFFAVSAAFFCQCTSNNRTALGMSMFLIFILYILRAIGDVGSEILSLISPLGLILRTKNFVENFWYPVFIILIISVVIALLSFVLAAKRDLGRGLFPERAGKRHASVFLSSPYGLALKLLRISAIIWSIVIFSFAAMYGSVFGDLDDFISSNETLKAVFASNPNNPLSEQFIGLLMAVMSIISTIPVITFINRAQSEERHGYSENILTKAVSRHAYLASYLLPAFIISIVLQLLSSLGFWSVGSMVLDTTPSLNVFITAALLYLPAIWFMIGITVVLIAFVPSMSSIVNYYLGYSAFSVYIGTIANLPQWTKKLTPFGHIPQYPIEKIEIIPIIILVVLFIVLAAIGFYWHRKRDLCINLR